MRGQHPNSRKNLSQPSKVPKGHIKATVRLQGPQKALEQFINDETPESRGKLVETIYAVPVSKFPPITIKQPKK